MKSYYRLKADTGLYAGDVVSTAFHQFKKFDGVEYKGTAMGFVLANCYPRQLHMLNSLDRPSDYQVRVGVADTLQNFCDEQGYILRQIKTTKRGACISFWITKRCK